MSILQKVPAMIRTLPGRNRNVKDGQRTGAEEEHYFVTATYEKKKRHRPTTGRYEMDFSQWKELKKGEKIELKIDAAGFAEINQK